MALRIAVAEVTIGGPARPFALRFRSETADGGRSDLTVERQRASEPKDALAITPDRLVAFSYSDELLRASADHPPACHG